MERAERALLGLFITLPALLGIYFTFISPRPYYIMEADSEPDYYYNAALIIHGERPSGAHHPGTPVYVLAALLLYPLYSFSGTLVGATQATLNASYILIGLLTSLTLYAFSKYALRGMPASISLLALTPILAWPSFLTYRSQLGPDSFVPMLGIAATIPFWSSLEDERFSVRKALACGAGLGLCVATKLSLLPVAGAIVLGYWFYVGFRGTRWVLAFRILLVPVVAVATFFLLTVPVWYSFPALFAKVISFSGAKPKLSRFGGATELLISASFPLAIMLVLVLAVFLGSFVSFARARIRAPRQLRERLDDGAAWAFAGSLLVYFLWAMSTVPISGTQRDPGVLLRNLAPSALVFPFLVICCWKRQSSFYLQYVGRNSIRIVLYVFVLLVLSFSLVRHVNQRSEWISETARKIEQANNAQQGLLSPGLRLAFWDGSPGVFFGPASFHFWGNYLYAFSHFDAELLASFPTLTHFHLRELSTSLVVGSVPRERTASRSPVYDAVRRIYRGGRGVWAALQRNYPSVFAAPRYKTQAGEIMAGEKSGIRISHILVLDELETRFVSIERVVAAVRTRLPHARTTYTSIGGESVYVIDGSGSSP